MQPIRILLVDDHKLFRDGVKALLSEVSEVQIVEEASSGKDCIQIYDPKNIDIVLMDIKMPEMDGIETSTQLIKKHGSVKILALTMHDEEAYISKMLHAGASGYLLKNAGKDELVIAIQKIVAGENYFSMEVASRMMSIINGKKTEEEFVIENNDAQLTKREFEVIKLIAEGFTSQDIADRLFISPRTVDTHRRNLLQKLNVKNTAELIKLAMKHEWV